MLTYYGLPLLRWLHEEVMPEAHRLLDLVDQYLADFRFSLEGPEDWPE